MQAPGKYSLAFEMRGRKYYVNYRINGQESVTFDFVAPTGTQTESYRLRKRRGGERRHRND